MEKNSFFISTGWLVLGTVVFEFRVHPASFMWDKICLPAYFFCAEGRWYIWEADIGTVLLWCVVKVCDCQEHMSTMPGVCHLWVGGCGFCKIKFGDVVGRYLSSLFRLCTSGSLFMETRCPAGSGWAQWRNHRAQTWLASLGLSITARADCQGGFALCNLLLRTDNRYFLWFYSGSLTRDCKEG